MIVRQFISWVRTAPASDRAEATRALSRAWLFSDLSDADRTAAEGAMLALLDDNSPDVRRAMSEVLGQSDYAPAAIIRALSTDDAVVAEPVLEFSPLLLDIDLVDIVATGGDIHQCAIARRHGLVASVSAAIAEVGSAAAVLELIENPTAVVPDFSWDRIIDRYGHLAAIREALLQMNELTPTRRLVLMSKLSDTLVQFTTGRNWLNPDRAERSAGDAMARSIVNISSTATNAELIELVRHMRHTGQLSAGLILRALLSGNVAMFDLALTELSGLPYKRVIALLSDGSSTSVNALLQRCEFPQSSFSAFSAALAARAEIGFVDTWVGVSRLHRSMVERVLTACEQDPKSSGELLVLLRRFATESAREEARAFCDELAIESAMAPFFQSLTRAAA